MEFKKIFSEILIFCQQSDWQRIGRTGYRGLIRGIVQAKLGPTQSPVH